MVNVCLYAQYFLGAFVFICAPRESFFKVLIAFLQNEKCMFCPAQNSRYAILQMIGFHEADMIVGITQCISSDCHPEPQSQMFSGLEDISMSQSKHFKIKFIIATILICASSDIFSFI